MTFHVLRQLCGFGLRFELNKNTTLFIKLFISSLITNKKEKTEKDIQVKVRTFSKKKG